MRTLACRSDARHFPWPCKQSQGALQDPRPQVPGLHLECVCKNYRGNGACGGRLLDFGQRRLLRSTSIVHHDEASIDKGCPHLTAPSPVCRLSRSSCYQKVQRERKPRLLVEPSSPYSSPLFLAFKMMLDAFFRFSSVCSSKLAHCPIARPNKDS